MKIQEETWRVLLERWEKLYYCTRDDILFNPETLEAVSPEQVRTLLK